MSGLGRASALGVAVGSATVLPGFLVGALSLQISDDLGVSVARVAVGVTVFFAAGAVGAGPLGRVAQAVGARAAMRAAALAVGACLLALAAVGTSLGSFLGLLTLAGLANAMAQTAINLFMAEEVPLERQGLGFGVKQSAIPAAIMVSGLALPLLALPFGWRPTAAICGLGAVAVGLVAGRGGRARRTGAGEPRALGPRLSRPLLLLAVGAALASFGPNTLGAYLVASAVETGLSEATAGVVLALGSAASLVMRIALGELADRRADYGFRTVVALLASGSLGFVLLSADAAGPFLAGALLAFTLGWGWPGLFNLAVVDRNRGAPASATGITQSGIYVGAAAGPALFGLLAAEVGYSSSWLVLAGVALLAAGAIALASASAGRVQA